MRKIKVLIVDDHKMIREGLCHMLASSNKTYHFIIDEAETGESGIGKIKRTYYDVVLMDYQLPTMNGAQTTHAMLQHRPGLNILALSNYDEIAYIENILKAGAKGYVLKNIGADELIRAITTILSGKKYFSNDVANKLIRFDDALFPGQILPVSKRKLNELSAIEKNILRLVANEYTSGEIAKKVGISKKTVDQHRQHLLDKLGARNTAGLIRAAIALKLVD